MTIKDIEKHAMAEKQRMDAIFSYNQSNETITINALYPYEIDLEGIKTPQGVIHWVEHLTTKTWMDVRLVREFIKRVYAIKGWNLFSKN